MKKEFIKKIQAAELLTCMGDDELGVFYKDDIEKVFEDFQTYCEPRKESLIERYKFWKISKGVMTIDEFVTDLQTKANKL